MDAEASLPQGLFHAHRGESMLRCINVPRQWRVLATSGPHRRFLAATRPGRARPVRPAPGPRSVAATRPAADRPDAAGARPDTSVWGARHRHPGHGEVARVALLEVCRIAGGRRLRHRQLPVDAGRPRVHLADGPAVARPGRARADHPLQHRHHAGPPAPCRPARQAPARSGENPSPGPACRAAAMDDTRCGSRVCLGCPEGCWTRRAGPEVLCRELRPTSCCLSRCCPKR